MDVPYLQPDERICSICAASPSFLKSPNVVKMSVTEPPPRADRNLTTQRAAPVTSPMTHLSLRPAKERSRVGTLPPRARVKSRSRASLAQSVASPIGSGKTNVRVGSPLTISVGVLVQEDKSKPPVSKIAVHTTMRILLNQRIRRPTEVVTQFEFRSATILRVSVLALVRAFLARRPTASRSAFSSAI